MTSHRNINYHRPVPRGFTSLTKAVFFLGLFVLSYHSIAPVSGTPSITHFDKVQHALGYALLAGLLALAWPRLRLLWVIVLPALYGVGLEVAQSVTPYGRTGSVFDAIANFAGVMIIVTLWSGWVKWRAKTSV